MSSALPKPGELPTEPKPDRLAGMVHSEQRRRLVLMLAIPANLILFGGGAYLALSSDPDRRVFLPLVATTIVFVTSLFVVLTLYYRSKGQSRSLRIKIDGVDFVVDPGEASHELRRRLTETLERKSE